MTPPPDPTPAPEDEDSDCCDIDFARGEKTRDEDLPPVTYDRRDWTRAYVGQPEPTFAQCPKKIGLSQGVANPVSGAGGAVGLLK